jgi:hypothetical protein
MHTVKLSTDVESTGPGKHLLNKDKMKQRHKGYIHGNRVPPVLRLSAHHRCDKSHVKYFRWQATSCDAKAETVGELITPAYAATDRHLRIMKLS